MNARTASAAALVVALAVLARPTTARAFRTLAERPDFAGTAHVVWTPAEITFSIERDGAPGVSLASLIEISEASFRTWTELECVDLAISYDASASGPAAPDDGRNTLEWLDTYWAELGFPADAMATSDLAFEQGEDGQWRVVESDVYFNAVESGDADSELRSIRAVLSHEIGHSIGLLHWPCEPGGADGVPDCDAVPEGASTSCGLCT